MFFDGVEPTGLVGSSPSGAGPSPSVGLPSLIMPVAQTQQTQPAAAGMPGFGGYRQFNPASDAEAWPGNGFTGDRRLPGLDAAFPASSLGLSRAAERCRSLLLQAPLACVNDLTGLAGIGRSTITNGVLELEDAGLAKRHSLGWNRRLQSRWWLTPGGCVGLPGAEMGHWNEECNLARLLERLPLAENFYACAGAFPDLGGFDEFRWLARVSADAAINFDLGWAAFFWTGLAENRRDLEKRCGKFEQDMLQLSAAGVFSWPSAYVFVAVDCFQVESARQAAAVHGWLPQFYGWCCVHGCFEVAGQPAERRGWVFQVPPLSDLGGWSWEKRLESTMWQWRNGWGAAQLMNLLLSWPGMSRPALRRFLQEGPNNTWVKAYIRVMRKEGLLEEVEFGRQTRLGLSPKAVQLLRQLDGVSYSSMSRHVLSQSWQSGRRIRRHEDGIMDLMARFAEAELPTAVGWRYWEYLGGSGGLAPDGLVKLNQSPYGPGWAFVEYERSARSDARVRRKLNGFASERRSNRWPVLLVCWDDPVEEVYWDVGLDLGSTWEGIPLLTTTVERLEALGPLHPECWLCYGEPAPLG